MGKRSDFPRIDRDCYDTPPEAVAPLIPHLPEGVEFWEPCAGRGSLVMNIDRAMETGRIWATDISPRAPWVGCVNALTAAPLPWLEFIITNPPWTRSILHPMIEHFSDMRPTWLLFDADWMHTKQSIPYMPRLRKIVSVGRVKWFADSPHTGKDNCCWYLFDKPSDEPAQFYGRTA